MTVAHHELVWNSLPDIRSTEQRLADDEIDALSRDEPNAIRRLVQDMIALRQEHRDRLAAKNNVDVELTRCPCCVADELAERDLVAEASLKVITGKLRRERRARIASLRIVAEERQLVLAVA